MIHTGIDAALTLRDELGPGVADISTIKAGISKYAANRASEQYPTNTEAAKLNLQYVVAYALANGPPGLSAFGEDAINDARVKTLARIVSVAIDPRPTPTRTIPPGSRSRSATSASAPAPEPPEVPRARPEG